MNRFRVLLTLNLRDQFCNLEFYIGHREGPDEGRICLVAEPLSRLALQVFCPQHLEPVTGPSQLRTIIDIRDGEGRLADHSVPKVLYRKYKTIGEAFYDIFFILQ